MEAMGSAMNSILNELQTIVMTAAGAAVTALCLYAFTWLRSYLGIVESDSNEGEIRRAALTEAGKLVMSGSVTDPTALSVAAEKVISDLLPEVKAEGYNTADIKDMITGAAAMVKGIIK
jgi:hypothetical protein